MKKSTILLWIQGAYFGITGLWPLISIESFQSVTGRKTDHLATGDENDHWLVMTVAVLVTAIAVSLCVAAWRKQVNIETICLAIGSAFGLMMIDVIYVIRRAILPIYLVDAIVEAVLIMGWIVVLLKTRASTST